LGWEWNSIIVAGVLAIIVGFGRQSWVSARTSIRFVKRLEVRFPTEKPCKPAVSPSSGDESPACPAPITMV
jgi:hypothetical protein